MGLLAIRLTVLDQDFGEGVLNSDQCGKILDEDDQFFIRVFDEEKVADIANDFAEGLSAERLIKLVEVAYRLIDGLIENIGRNRLALSAEGA